MCRFSNTKGGAVNFEGFGTSQSEKLYGDSNDNWIYGGGGSVFLWW